jgi:hypothetical protein
MSAEIYVRDPYGKPVKAELIRRLRIKGFRNLALAKRNDRFTVTELRTGASVAESFVEEWAIHEAKDRLATKTTASYLAGIEQIVAQYGELPVIAEASA